MDRAADPYAAQLDSLLRAETRHAEGSSTPRVSLFARTTDSNTNSGNADDEEERLARALQESARTAAAASRSNDDEERLRLALAVSRSTQEATRAAASAPAGTTTATDLERLQEATRASEAAFLEQRRGMFDEVLGVLRSCSPILASYIDEHCGIFVDGATADGEIFNATAEVEIFNDFRRTVDALLTDLLREVGMGIDDVARTLQLAREQPASSSGSLVEHLLAVESFTSFRRLMAQRNHAIHAEARAALPSSSDAGGAGPSSSGPPGYGSWAGAPVAPALAAEQALGRDVVLEEATSFATVQEAEGAATSRDGTVELVRIERERDLPRSRLADALADAAPRRPQ